MEKYFDLTGQVAVVTGCSTGLGVQMAKALANQGAKIVAIARRKELIDAVAKEITDTYKVDAIGIKCDITDTAAVDATVKEILANARKRAYSAVNFAMVDTSRRQRIMPPFESLKSTQLLLSVA